MGRPPFNVKTRAAESKMPSLRTAIVNAKVTPEEREEIRAKAQATGETVSNYLRRLALGHRLRTVRPLADQNLILQLARLGNNINQLTRMAHNRQLPNSDALKRRLEELLSLLRVLAEQIAKASS